MAVAGAPLLAQVEDDQLADLVADGLAGCSAVSLRDAELAQTLWTRNARTDVVAFHLDRWNRVVGRIDALAATLDEVEHAFYVRRLAEECDRLEVLLVGDDRG